MPTPVDADTFPTEVCHGWDPTSALALPRARKGVRVSMYGRMVRTRAVIVATATRAEVELK